MIDDTTSESMRPKMKVIMIDYGLAFPNGMVSKWLSWHLLTPPECYNKPYNSIGVNFYQFGRVALQIILGKTFADYNEI